MKKSITKEELGADNDIGTPELTNKYKSQTPGESGAVVTEGDKEDDLASLRALLANPDTKMAIKNYGSVEKYKAMIKDKIARSVKNEEAQNNPNLKKHIVQVTVIDSHNEDPEKRKEVMFKKYSVSATSSAEAVTKAQDHFKDAGFIVKSAKHYGIEPAAGQNESLDLKRQIGQLSLIVSGNHSRKTLKEFVLAHPITGRELNFTKIQEQFDRFLLLCNK